MCIYVYDGSTSHERTSALSTVGGASWMVDGGVYMDFVSAVDPITNQPGSDLRGLGLVPTFRTRAKRSPRAKPLFFPGRTGLGGVSVGADDWRQRLRANQAAYHGASSNKKGPSGLRLIFVRG